MLVALAAVVFIAVALSLGEAASDINISSNQVRPALAIGAGAKVELRSMLRKPCATGLAFLKCAL
eukprot:7064200-Karenia_brevis.AAC.1